LLGILGHFLEDEAHLLLGQATVAKVVLGEAGQELSITAAEADAVVVSGLLVDLLVVGLVLLIDPNQSLDRPHRVAGQLDLDEGEGVFLGGVHRAISMAHDL